VLLQQRDQHVEGQRSGEVRGIDTLRVVRVRPAFPLAQLALLLPQIFDLFAARTLQPAGADEADDRLQLDRGLTRITTVSPTGELKGTRSIAEHGTTSSSSADVDLQRVDGRGFAYFLDPMHGRFTGTGTAREATVIRFDPAAQKKETVVTLRMSEMRTTSSENGLTLSRAIVGTPADGWGVAPDGRVAVVRAEPYRVEWYGTDGKVVRGPVVAFDRLPMTEADKQAFTARTSSGAAGGGAPVGVGRPGEEPAKASRPPTEFAATKPPFDPADVIVSPDARVWVMRTRPIDVREVLYDVFDRTGSRVDRIELPAGSRIVGFGPSSIYVRHNDDAGRCELKKYRIPNL
jgi:hypothetical protein